MGMVCHRKILGLRVLAWQQHISRCHSVSFVMFIAGAKFISEDILQIHYFIV